MSIVIDRIIGRFRPEYGQTEDKTLLGIVASSNSHPCDWAPGFSYICEVPVALLSLASFFLNVIFFLDFGIGFADLSNVGGTGLE